MALLIPFAIRNTDRRMVAPDEVARGAACDCSCPGCGSPVLARQGDEKVWHFAHIATTQCDQGYAEAVKSAARQLLSENPWLPMASTQVKASARTAFGDMATVWEDATPQTEVALSKIREEHSAHPAAGTLLAEVDGEPIRIVLMFDVSPEQGLIEHWRATGERVLQIDLTRFATEQVTKDSLESVLFGATPAAHWLTHPEIACAQDRVLERLRIHLAAEDERHAVWRRETYAQQKAAERDQEQQQLIRRLTHPDAHLSWRASLPSQELVQAALSEFAKANRIDLHELVSRFALITSRGWLARVSPRELIERWCIDLSVSRADMIMLFYKAGYLL